MSFYKISLDFRIFNCILFIEKYFDFQNNFSIYFLKMNSIVFL